MAHLTQWRRIDLIDGVVFFLLIFWGVLIDWGDWHHLKPLALFSFFSIYFFDFDVTKRMSWLLALSTLIFFFAFWGQPQAVPYSAYGIVQLGLIAWISMRLRPSIQIRWLWTITLGLVFFLSMFLSLGTIPKEEEIFLFLILQLALCFMPVFIEREVARRSSDVLRLCAFQQFVLRAFFIYWCGNYYYELRALGLSDEFKFTLIGAMFFLPVVNAVNWGNSHGSFLRESFLSLLTLYIMLSFNDKAQAATTVLVFAGAALSINRLPSVISRGWARVVHHLEEGGFGSFFFLVAMAMNFWAHADSSNFEFVFIAVLIFLYSWSASVEKVKMSGQEQAGSQSLYERFAYQWIASFWLVWILW